MMGGITKVSLKEAASVLAPRMRQRKWVRWESVFWEQRPARVKVWKPERDQSSMVMERGGWTSTHFASKGGNAKPIV